MTLTRRTLSLLAALALALVAVQPAQAQEAGLVGDVPSEGVALVHWTSGGTIEDLRAAVDDDGCEIASVWVTIDGRYVGYILGMPGFVNAGWSASVGPEIEAETTLLLRCAERPPRVVVELECSGEVDSTVFDYPAGYVGTATAREALDLGLAGVPVPAGTFVEAFVSEDRVDWALVSEDGLTVGHLRTTRLGGGWRLDGGQWCA